MLLDTRRDKSSFLISFYVGGQLVTEHVPAMTSDIEFKIRARYRRILSYFGVPHYYWHYRFFLPSKTLKKEDLRFLLHVIDAHDGEPEDKYEKRHFNKAMALYGNEYEYLIKPLREITDNNRSTEDSYVRAYYKKWLSGKSVSPEFKRLYHGVDTVEMAEIFPLIVKSMQNDKQRLLARIKYHHKTPKK